MVEYAPNGLFGILTPQANTTVEPELSILAPPGTAMIAARLVSDLPVMDDRLVDYSATIETVLDRFANAPLIAAGFACTGASYLVPIEDERARVARIGTARGYPLVTAADAIADAVALLGSNRIAILSPYGDKLHEDGVAYWRRRGLKIAEVRRIRADGTAFHPIYALGGSAAQAAVEAVLAHDIDCVVILGTGLASLPAIHRFGGAELPVISPNLCLMWRLAAHMKGDAPTLEGLMPWLTGENWGQRLHERVQV